MSSSERTEKASPKRREDARKRGQLARRPEIGALAGFIAALLMLRATGVNLTERALNLFRSLLVRAPNTNELTAAGVSELAYAAVADLALLVLPLAFAAIAASVAANFAQGGLSFAPEALKPRGERFSPAANFKRAFSANAPVELVKSSLKLAGLIGVSYGTINQAINAAPRFIGSPTPHTLAAIGTLAYDLSLRACAVLMFAAALDYGYGFWSHEKSLRMSKQDVKDEYKQQEGDPFVKSLRRRAARQIANRRMMQDVPHADVIVTNPTHFAVALKYDRDAHAAPKVVAKGADFMAQRIREIAGKHKISIVENPPLARALFRATEPGDTIPADLFRVVAELLAFVYRQKEKK